VRQRTGSDLDQAVDSPEAWHWLSEYLDKAQPDPGYLRLIAQALADPPLEGCEYSGLSAGDVVAGVSRHLTSTGAKSQFWHVSVMWPRYRMLAAELGKKNCSLCLADDTGSFVCSDSPVGAAWPDDWVAERDPKYADEGALVTFPLDRHTALVAGLDGNCDARRRVSKAAVAELNSQTMRRATRFVFAPSKGFPFALPDGTTGAGRDVFELLNWQDGDSSASLS